MPEKCLKNCHFVGYKVINLYKKVFAKQLAIKFNSTCLLNNKLQNLIRCNNPHFSKLKSCCNADDLLFPKIIDNGFNTEIFEQNFLNTIFLDTLEMLKLEAKIGNQSQPKIHPINKGVLGS